MTHRGTEWKVGLVIILALSALGFLSLSIRKTVFQKTYPLTAVFPQVDGLKRGAPVKLAGVEAGSVQQVTHVPARRQVEVRMALRREFAPVIRADATATIATVGLLGEKYVELGYGHPSAPPAGPGAQLRGLAPVSSTELVAGLANLGAQLSGVLDENRAVLRNGLFEFHELTRRLREIVQHVQEQPGGIHDWIYGSSAVLDTTWEETFEAGWDEAHPKPELAPAAFH